MSCILFVDVNKPLSLTFTLEGGGPVKKKVWRGRRLNFLLCLDKFLKDNRLKLADLKGLVLVEGKGTFSGVRTGATILNAIHFVTGAPVAGLSDANLRQGGLERCFRQPRPGLIKPIYNGEPHITAKPVTCIL